MCIRDSADTAAGATAAAYGDLTTVPIGKSYTYYQVTLERKVIISGSVSDGSNTCLTNASDNSIDTAVTTLSVCSIPDRQRDVNEIYRVVKPTGKLIFSEHGLSPDKVVATIQNGIEFFYPKISGGCHANKDIPNLITNAKYNIDNLETMYLPGTQKFLGYNFWGTANK